MSMQSFEFDESTIHGNSAVDRPSSGNARARRKEEKRNNSRINGSPYGTSVINPRQAWLNSMNQGQSFNNLASSGYGLKDPISPPQKPKSKPVHRASHLDKEEMYDEIQRLKELIAAFTKEKALRQTRITKLEKELNKKDKLLEQTYSQTQSTYGPVSERSYGATSIETNSTITGLRQKCHKYECLLRDKENEIKTIKSDLKSTRLQELEIMCDTYYQEISRLTQVMEQRSDHVTSRVVTPRASTPRASTPIHGSEREKILEAKLQQLELDNTTLKKQIMKTTTQSVGDSTGLISEYASLTRAQLEEKHQQKCKELFDAKLTIDELKTSSSVSDETIKQLKSQQTKNKENLEKLADDRGTLERKLASVDGEHQAQKLVIRRLNKTVRHHEDEMEKLKKQSDKEHASLKMRLTDKTKIITNLEEEIQSLKDQITSLENDKAKNEQKKITATRSKKNTHDNVDDREPSIEKSDEKETEEKFEKKESKDPREKKIAKSEKEREIERVNAKIAEEEKKKEREEAAARKIQKNYRNYNLANSVSILQRVLRGHALRCKVAKEEHNQSAEVIQSALKGFAVKSQHLESLKKESEDQKVAVQTQKTNRCLGTSGFVASRSEGNVERSRAARQTNRGKTENSLEGQTKKPEVSKHAAQHARKPGFERNAKTEATPKKYPTRKTESQPKVAVPTSESPAQQIEPSTDEDDLIMM